MFALISPTEQVSSYDGQITGIRVAQVSESEFPVAPPFFWMACSADTVADQVYYDATSQTIVALPVDPAIAELALLQSVNNVNEV